MSTQPTYRITDALAALDAATLNLEEVRRILLTPVPPPPPPGYTLRLGDDPAEAIADLNAGDNLYVVGGTHFYNLHLTKPLSVIGDDLATFTSWQPWTDWTYDGAGRWWTAYDRFGGRLHHRITNNASFPLQRQALHNEAARPEYVKMGGKPVKTTYNDKSGRLYAEFGAGADLSTVVIATRPQLLTADDGVNGVVIEGITFDGAANTTKQGAVQVYGEGWKLRRVTVKNVNTIGFIVGGIGHEFYDCWADDCGQMGWAGKVSEALFSSCGMVRANWKGFDPGWEAGMKFSYSNRNTWASWTALDCDGPGFWLDIYNDENILDGFVIRNSLKTGAMLEHWARKNTYRNGEISGTREWVTTGAQAGLQVQSNCHENVFENIDITDSGSAVLYKAQEGVPGPKNRDKGSSHNIFRHINTHDAGIRIEGGASDKDRFENIT